MLTACVPDGPAVPQLDGDPIAVEFALPNPASLDGVTDATWSTGILGTFDDVAEMLPEVAPLREQVALQDAEFGATVMATLGIEPTILASQMPDPGRFGAGVRAITDQDVRQHDDGRLAPGAVGGAMDSADASGLGPGEPRTEGGTTVTSDDQGNITVIIEMNTVAGSGGSSANSSAWVRYDGVFCPAADGKFERQRLAFARRRRVLESDDG